MISQQIQWFNRMAWDSVASMCDPIWSIYSIYVWYDSINCAL